MKTVSFYAKGNRSGDNLHIETDGCVINVFVGLTDEHGHQVTRVDISPDDESRGGDENGRIWVQDGPRIIRLHEDETELPEAASVTVRQHEHHHAAGQTLVHAHAGGDRPHGYFGHPEDAGSPGLSYEDARDIANGT